MVTRAAIGGKRGTFMKIVVLRSPKALRYILAKIFGVNIEKNKQ